MPLQRPSSVLSRPNSLCANLTLYRVQYFNAPKRMLGVELFLQAIRTWYTKQRPKLKMLCPGSNAGGVAPLLRLASGLAGFPSGASTLKLFTRYVASQHVKEVALNRSSQPCQPLCFCFFAWAWRSASVSLYPQC